MEAQEEAYWRSVIANERAVEAQFAARVRELDAMHERGAQRREERKQAMDEAMVRAVAVTTRMLRAYATKGAS